MPTLKDNPPMLPPHVSSVAGLAGDWWVAHTKPRCEKALAYELLVDGIGYYLPMAWKVHMSGGRKRRVLMPLFPSYVFLCGDADARVRALQTGRIVKTLPVMDPTGLVSELQSIERALAANGTLDLYPFAAVGQRCRVKAGPFIGIEGTVAKREERDILVLQVAMLGCGVSLQIDMSLLEPAA